MNETDIPIMIMSYKRPGKMHTARVLRELQYEPWFIVVDDEDPTLEEYRQKFGDRVVVFDYSEARRNVDMGDNINYRTRVSAVNEMPNIVQRLGYRYYILFDDDYTHFDYTYDSFLRRNVVRNGKTSWSDIKITAKTFTRAVHAYFRYFRTTERFTSLAMAQRGDFFGGKRGTRPVLMRKVMNSFFCDVQRPVRFYGRLNEDVTAYTLLGRMGELFGTCTMVCLRQVATQQTPGGVSDVYIAEGTYVKTFYSVLYAPSCVRVGMIENATAKRNSLRIHHRVRWKYAAPKILRESVKRTTGQNGFGGARSEI